MAIPQILEVAVGLIVVYYVLGAIVSFITQRINETFETRGAALDKYLKIALGDKVVDLKALPQIKALQPIRYKNWYSVLTAATEAKKLEQIPATVLVDAVFDITGLSGKSGLDAKDMICIIEQLPASESRDAMIKWIQQGVTDINELRHRTNDYLCGILDQAAATFKANARSFVIILSILITLAFGTDTIQLANDLWNSSELRAMAAAQANQVVQSQGTDVDISTLVNDLGAFSIRLGWWNPQNFPRGLAAPELARFILLKVLGLTVTAIAVSQGSSFWYDVLKKITARPSGNEVSKDEAPA